MTDIETV